MGVDLAVMKRNDIFLMTSFVDLWARWVWVHRSCPAYDCKLCDTHGLKGPVGQDQRVPGMKSLTVEHCVSGKLRASGAGN